MATDTLKLRDALRPLAVSLLLAAALVTSCWLIVGRAREQGRPSSEQTGGSFSSLAAAVPAPPTSARYGDREGEGHAANVLPGAGPPRIESKQPRSGPVLQILPGQGLGPLRFGADRRAIERVMGAPCDDDSEAVCRYVQRGIELRLRAGVVREMRVFRKGREAVRARDGSIVEYGTFNGAVGDIEPGMSARALQRRLGGPPRVEPIVPMASDGLVERQLYDGMTLELDAWSTGTLVLGAVILTEPSTAAQAER